MKRKPPKPKGIINFRCSDSVKAAIKAAAYARDMRPSEYIRIAIASALAAEASRDNAKKEES